MTTRIIDPMGLFPRELKSKLRKTANAMDCKFEVARVTYSDPNIVLCKLTQHGGLLDGTDYVAIRFCLDGVTTTTKMIQLTPELERNWQIQY